MQKGYKRQAKGMAVLRCFIGIFMVIIFVLLGYFALQMDYSDRLDPNAQVRPYVEASPSPTADPMSAVFTTPEPTQAPTPRPTVKPTATPEPTAEPSPTPVPTAFPESIYAPMRIDGFVIPEPSAKEGRVGITESYRSEANDNGVVQVRGYAYLNEEGFDAAASQLMLVITQESSGRSVLALPVKSEGVSGVDHSGALCANAAAGDFEAVLNVSGFADDIYMLGAVLAYVDADGQSCVEYFVFENSTFTVLGGQIISDIAASAN